MAHYVDDPWAISDNDEEVAMAGGNLDIMDVWEDEHVRTVPYPTLQSRVDYPTKEASFSVWLSRH